MFSRNGDNNKVFSWSGNRGKIEISNDYSPVRNVKAMVYKSSDLKDKNLMKTSECSFRIINKWVCGDYIPSACTIEVGSSEKSAVLYADENGSPVTVTYKIKSDLNRIFSECDCREWKIDISGDIRSVGCNRSAEFSKHEIEETIKLFPNNASNEFYNLSGRLITSRKILPFIININVYC